MPLNETNPPTEGPVASEASGEANPAAKAERLPRAERQRKRDPLYFVVILLLIADIVFGLGLALFAEQVIEFEPLAVGGLGLAALGLGILAYFVLFGSGRPQK